MENNTETESYQTTRHPARGLRRVVPLALLLSAWLLSPTPARGDFEVSMGNRKLQATHIKTAAPVDVYAGECEPIAEPIIFDCPGVAGSTCSLLIHLSGQYIGVTPGWSGNIAWSVDGSTDGFFPSSGMTVASEVDRIWTSNTVAVTVAKKGVSKGWHRLWGCFYLVNSDHPSDGSEPGFIFWSIRTVTLEVFKP
jgi:hypothetical protein